LINKRVDGTQIYSEFVLEKLLDELHDEFLLRIGRVTGSEQNTFSRGKSYAPTKVWLSGGGCLGSRKELLRL
jgi:hypothetical protein